jgi:deoxycytidylate deaminase
MSTIINLEQLTISKLNKKEYFIQQAYLEALKSPMIKNYGAILVHHNKIISRGYNYYKSHLTSKLSCCLLRG